MNDSTIAPRPGTWVQVWAQVVSEGRPEDLVVRLESKSEQFKAAVRREHVTVPEVLPRFARQCTRMHETKPNRFVRCLLHEGHDPSSDHVGPKDVTWSESTTSGYFEEA